MRWLIRWWRRLNVTAYSEHPIFRDRKFREQCKRLEEFYRV